MYEIFDNTTLIDVFLLKEDAMFYRFILRLQNRLVGVRTLPKTFIG